MIFLKRMEKKWPRTHFIFNVLIVIALAAVLTGTCLGLVYYCFTNNTIMPVFWTGGIALGVVVMWAVYMDWRASNPRKNKVRRGKENQPSTF